MKLFRFMSAEECFKLMKGETLENSTDHSKRRGSASTAKGFCFGVGDEEQAKKDFRRLKGIVDLGVLIVFTLKHESESRFTPCQGRYVDYTKVESDGKTIVDYPLGMEPSCMVDEFCTCSYSLEDFEDYRVYCTLIDHDKHPSDKDFLELRDIGNPPMDVIDEKNLDKGKEVAEEIVRLINSKDINAGETLMALSIAVSCFIETVSEQSTFTRQRCLCDFVAILNSCLSD